MSTARGCVTNLIEGNFLINYIKNGKHKIKTIFFDLLGSRVVAEQINGLIGVSQLLSVSDGFVESLRLGRCFAHCIYDFSHFRGRFSDGCAQNQLLLLLDLEYEKRHFLVHRVYLQQLSPVPVEANRNHIVVHLNYIRVFEERRQIVTELHVGDDDGVCY